LLHLHALPHDVYSLTDPVAAPIPFSPVVSVATLD
jgi:hypothetical protein